MPLGFARQNPMTPLKKQLLPGDIVIHNPGPGAYVLAKMGGQQIGTATYRLDAMRRACGAARLTGANVWVCHEESSKIYHEVLCP
jgi:hypothetical protein